ncbi:MAG: response regulator [Spirochaetes bacterium]|nr:response regulator [Spirochaetota bacterium]
MLHKVSDYFLRQYKQADYVIQQKSRLILRVSFVIIAFIFIIIFTNTLRNNASVEVISPLVSGILFMGISVYLLKSGRFSLSAHLVLCICLISVWASMFFDINEERMIVLDTIVYVIGLLVLTPVVVSRYRISIFVYCAVNMAVFIVFCLRAMDLYGLSLFFLSDYIIDNVIAIMFVSIISYHIFRINDGALRLAEEEMEKNRELAQHLEEMVYDRTGELEEANAKLKELDRVKSSFFANISHEIRTPLTMILAPVQSALRGDQGVAIDRALLVTVERNAARLVKLVNNLLDLARLESGRMPLVAAEQDVVAFIRSYVDSVRPASETRRLSIRVAVSREPIKLCFDAEKMDKVFMNLFSNAFKYTEPGGAVTISVMDDDRGCFIEFEDNGSGIPPENLDIIFDRFGQAHAATARKQEGSGIGLSLVRELVEMHGGTISVKSVYVADNPVGHGTVFSILLPKGRKHLERVPGVQFVEPGGEGDRELLMQRAAEVRFLAEAQVDAEQPPSPALPSKPEATLLIVEDNADMRKYLLTLLERRYAVRCARNGREGLAMAAELRPDLIITDVMMPVMSGYEMMRRIRESGDLKNVPVIILSARMEPGEMEDDRLESADDYITKPFNGHDLLERIEALLAKRR